MTDTSFPWERNEDTVVFETPEQTRIELRVAPFGTRIVAAVIDRILLVLLSLGLVILGVATLFTVGGGDVVLTVIAACIVLQFLLGLFYFVWGEVRWEGQTFGKRKMKIRTMMITGQGVTLGAAIVRNLARLVDEIPLLWVVPALTRGKRRAGDLLAGTVVVVVTEREETDALGHWRLATSYQDLAERRFYFPGDVTQRVFPDDLNLLEHLGQQIQSAPLRQRRKAVRSVAERYVERLGLQDQAEEVAQDPTRFLRELTLFLESHFENQAY